LVKACGELAVPWFAFSRINLDANEMLKRLDGKYQQTKNPSEIVRASHFTVYPVEYEERIIPRGEPCEIAKHYFNRG